MHSRRHLAAAGPGPGPAGHGRRHRRRKHLRAGRALAPGGCRPSAPRLDVRHRDRGIGPASPLAQCDHRRAPGWRLMGIP